LLQLSTLKKRPKKLSKRQARALEKQEAAAASTATGTATTARISPRGKRSPKVSNNKKILSTKKGPSAPPEGKKIGRSGNIAYGGHGKDWQNTTFAARLGNNHLLRVKREQAARIRQLQAQDAPSSLLSGKAKKAVLKERRAKKRQLKLLKAEEEKMEAEAAAEAALETANANNAAFEKLQIQ